MARNLNGRLRDSQRRKVYQSEIDTYADYLPLFGSSKEVTDYALQIMRDDYVKEKYGMLGEVNLVFPKANLKHATCYSTGHYKHKLKFPRNLWNKRVVIHELAHAYINANHVCFNVQPHGPQFCTLYLDLVRHFMGEAWARTLARAYVQNNVKFWGIEWH
jgi:putative metallohydrolase (TIGR04338 family)